MARPRIPLARRCNRRRARPSPTPEVAARHVARSSILFAAASNLSQEPRAGCADAGCDRRRVRRHRHQPALRVSRCPGAVRDRRFRGIGDFGRAESRAVVADPRRLGQIRPVPDARRQSWRGRRACADRTGPAFIGIAQSDRVDPGCRRRVAVFTAMRSSRLPCPSCPRWKGCARSPPPRPSSTSI